jgi:type IV secretory pathway TraG/TraD family ATPase VirD4
MTTTAFRNWLLLWRRAPRSITHLCEQIDARYGIPRPASAPHLPSYHAAMAFLGVCVEGTLIIIAGFVSALIWWKAAYWLSISIEVELFCHVMAMVGPLISLAEVAGLPLQYFQVFQRSTYGTARWADPPLLKDLRLARRKSEPLEPGELPLGGLGKSYEVVLNAAQTMCHLAMFGPPGSGKSATFFMTWLRAWSATGSAIVLDPKGELYDQTAHKFENVYRIDFQQPERSDRWNFLPSCRHNAELAHEAASIILHVDANKNSSADPFWKEAETAALTAIILHLAQWHARPTPAMIQELVSTYSLAQLNELMMASADPKVPLYWGMFTKVEPKLQGGVLIGLGVRCAAFNIPNAKAISSPITPMMAARGVRLVDFAELRQPRTAVYVVVPEGDAARYKVVLATLFGLAASHLRKGDLTPESAPVLFNFDEAGNIFIHGLNELLGVGRGRKMAVALGYQNIGQVYHHYGADGGDAVLGSIGTMIFLPGLDHRTAEYASKRIGQATVWQSTSVDVKEGAKFDSERTSEVGRSLMDASEVRRMVKYRQAVAIIGNAPPVRFSYPPIAKLAAPQVSNHERIRGQVKGLAYAPNRNSFTASEPVNESLLSSAPILVSARTASEADVVIATDNRPAFSFGQMISQQSVAVQPEYDPDHFPLLKDPCFDDAPDRIGFER